MRRNGKNVNPYGTEAKNPGRLKFLIYRIETTQTSNRNHQYSDMMNLILSDVYCFYITERTAGCYLPNEMSTNHTAEHKIIITKVIFTAVLATSCHNAYCNKPFEGKSEVLQCFSRKQIRQGSKKKPTRAIETKVVQEIDEEQIWEMIINKVILSTCEKWPRIWSGQYINHDASR